jgi:broad specificity phosphatase PhoE
MIRIVVICICMILLTGPGCAPAFSQGAKGEAGAFILFVVRHGEAYRNLPSHAHMPRERQDALTQAGVEQARKVGRYLRDKGIVAVVASPTGRTRQTARIVSLEIGLGGVYSEDPAFRSMKKGRTPEGKPVSWSWRSLQWEAGRDPRPQGGESLQDATSRAVLGVNTLMDKYPGKAVAVVTHSDICAGLAGRAKNTPYHQRYAEHKPGLGSVIEIEIDPPGLWKLK